MELREQATQRPAHRQDLVTIGGGATRLRGSGETVPIGFGAKVRNPDPTEVVSGERMHRVLLSDRPSNQPVEKRMRRRTEARRRD
jgi:hypothetical protein